MKDTNISCEFVVEVIGANCIAFMCLPSKDIICKSVAYPSLSSKGSFEVAIHDQIPRILRSFETSVFENGPSQFDTVSSKLKSIQSISGRYG